MITLPVVAKLLCIIAFLVHTGINIWQNFEDDKMVVGEQYVKLATIPFPFVFDISISPGIDLVKLNMLGFENPLSYYIGSNQYGHNTTGWSGRYENGTIANDTLG